MKKRLSILLTFALVLTMLTPAFAFAASSDVEGTKYEGAVESLSALSVLKGYPDGTFKPDNTITRAEFSAVAVRLLGLESAAQVSNGITKFNDMGGYEWASGYVNVAAQEGIILGYPDGSFKPGNPVSQAEALTMLVRVLGYEPVVKQEGWPTNYLVKASELGLTKGVTNVSSSAPASRGTVALFSENTLYVDKMIQSGVSNGMPTYRVDEGNTLLARNLGATEYNGKVIDSYGLLDSPLNADEFTVDAIYELDNFLLPVNEEITFTSDKDLTGLFGRNVTVWANSDLEVIKVIPNDTIYEGVVDTSDGINSVTFVGKRSVNPVDFANASLVLNYETYTGVDLQGFEGKKVKYTVNKSGTIVYMEAVDYSSVTPVVVDDVDFDELLILDKLNSANHIDLNGLEYNIDVAELNEFDVVYKFGTGDKVHFDVFSGKASGKLGSIYEDDDLKIGAARYALSEDGTFFSSDNGTKVNDNANETHFLGKNVTAVLDAFGDVLFVYGLVEIDAPNNYMIVTGYDFQPGLGGDSFYIEAMGQDNKSDWYQLTSDTKYFNTTGADVTNDVYVNGGPTDNFLTWIGGTDYSFADIQITEDGTVGRIHQLPIPDYTGTTLDISANYSDFIESRNLVKVNGEWTPVAADAVFFDKTDLTIPVENEFVSWHTIANASTPLLADVELVDGKVAYIYVLSGSIVTTTDDIEGILVTAYNTPEDTVVLALNQQGVVTEYEVSKSAFPTAADLVGFVNDYVDLTLTNDKVSSVAPVIDIETVPDVEKYEVKSTGTLKIVSTDGFDPETLTTHWLEEDALIYDLTGAEPAFVDLSSVKKGQVVVFKDTDTTPDGLYDIVLIVE